MSEDGAITAALVLYAQKVERRALALLSHDGKEIAATQMDVVLASDALGLAIEEHVGEQIRAALDRWGMS